MIVAGVYSTDMSNIFYDSECFADYYLIAFTQGDAKHSFIITDKQDDRLRIRSFLRMRAKETFVGFNVVKYDNPLLAYVLKNKEATPLDIRAYSDRIINGDRSNGEFYYSDVLASGSGREKLTLCKNIIDLIAIVPKISALKELACRADYPVVLESSVDIFKKKTTAAERMEIERYCYNDIAITEHLFNSSAVQQEVLARKTLAQKYSLTELVALTRKSSNVSGRVLLEIIGGAFDEVTERKYKISSVIDKRVKFKSAAFRDVVQKIADWEIDLDVSGQSFKQIFNIGALTVEFGRGGMHGKVPCYFLPRGSTYVLDADVASFYPSLIMNLELAPKGHEGFHKAFSELKALRAEAPKKSALSDAYKLIMNASTGSLKDIHSKLYDPRTNDAMCINGQLVILELIEGMHLSGLVVTFANTDGISVLIHNKAERAVADSVFAAWEKKWGFVLEYQTFVTGFFKDSNNYYAVRDDGIEKGRGAELSRDRKAKTYPIVGKMVMQHLIHGTGIAFPKEYAITDCVAFHERDKWGVVGDEVEGLNPSGMNRFYQSRTAENVVGGVFSDGRRIKVATNVAGANVLADVRRGDIDKKSYIELVKKYVDKHVDIGIPVYRKELGEPVKRKVRKEDIQMADGFGEWLLDNGFVTSVAVGTRGQCPQCNKKKILVRYDSGWKCFFCNEWIRLSKITNK